MESLKIGDFCFAHVKGFPWWPAVITNKEERIIKKGTKVVFSVVFYGTNESAALPPTELRCLSEENVGKFVNKGALRRKHYQEGFDQMLKEQASILIEEDRLGKVNLPEEEMGTFEEEKKSQEQFLSSMGLRKAPPVSEIDKIEANSNADTEPAIDDLEFDMEELEPVTTVCKMTQLGERFDCTDDEDDNEESDIHFGNTKSVAVARPSSLLITRDPKDSHDDDRSDPTNTSMSTENKRDPKRACKKNSPMIQKKKPNRKGQQKGTSKLVRSLQEDESEGFKKFNENIEVKDGYFFCKICSKFSSTTKLLAQSHVVKCGTYKKKGRPVKKSECLYCGEKFSSLKDMHAHHFRNHANPEYSCSTCQKSFKRRQAFRRHLVIHKEQPKLPCPHDGCNKVFRYNCDLKRHIQTHRRPKPSFETLVEEGVECDFTNFEVDLNELQIGNKIYNMLTYKELPSALTRYQRNHTSFQSSLGGSTPEDWEVICLSDLLPFNESDPEAIETSIFTDSNGCETLKFAWLSVQQTPVPVTQLSDIMSDEELLINVNDILIDAGYGEKLDELSLGNSKSDSHDPEVSASSVSGKFLSFSLFLLSWSSRILIYI